VLWAVTGHTPRSEFLYRLPSFVAVELGIIMLYALTRRLWGPVVALVVALCAQLSPYLAFYAAEARNYGMWFFCVTASAVAAVHWYDAVNARAAPRRVWGWTAVLAVINTVGLWTHAFHVFVLFGEVVILAGAIALGPMAPDDAAAGRSARSGAAELATAALFAPWIVVIVRAAHAGTAGVTWTRPFS